MGFFDRLFAKPLPAQLDDAAFAALAIKECVRLGNRTYRWDAEAAEIRGENGFRGTLANVVREYNDLISDEERRHCVAGYARGLCDMREVPSRWEFAAHALRPQIQRRMLVEELALKARAGELENSGIPFLPLGDHTCVTLAFDTPENMLVILQHHLDAWGVTFEEALERAKRNLALHPSTMVKVSRGAITMLQWSDNYGAARMLLPGTFDGVELKGRAVVLPVDRDSFLVTDEANPAQVAFAIVFGKGLVDGVPRPLGCQPLVQDGGRWATLASDHPGVEAIHRDSECAWLAREYQHQQPLLAKAYEREGEDVFVASVMGVQDGDDTQTLCLWNGVIDQELPRTGLVGFVPDLGADPILVPWGVALDTCAALVAPIDGVYPVRYRTRGFPDAAQLEALRQHAFVPRPPAGAAAGADA